jgi:hypothetical protein
MVLDNQFGIYMILLYLLDVKRCPWNLVRRTLSPPVNKKPGFCRVFYWRREEGAEPSWVRVEPGFLGNPGDTRASADADARHPVNVLFGYQ